MPSSRQIPRAVDIKPVIGYRLWIRYSDGVEGEVDLSHLVGRGVFELWNEGGVFKQVHLGAGTSIRWSDQVEICADSTYLRLTGQSPSDLFPRLRAHQGNA